MLPGRKLPKTHFRLTGHLRINKSSLFYFETSIKLNSEWPGPEARPDAHPPGMRTVAGSILGSGNILSWR